MKHFVTLPLIHTPAHIVFAGSSDTTIGAFRQISGTLENEISRGQVRLTVISATAACQQMGLLHECLAGEVAPVLLEVTPGKMFPHADLVQGRVTANDYSGRKLDIQLVDGCHQELQYDYFIDARSPFMEATEKELPAGIALRTAADISKLRLQIFGLVEKAAMAKDKFSAARLLRAVVAGDGIAGVELAASLANCFTVFCKQFGLTELKPTIYLVMQNADVYEAVALNRRLETKLLRQFYTTGIRVIKGRKMLRTNTDGAVLDDGSFLNASFVVSTGASSNGTVAYATNRFGQVDGFLVWSAVNILSAAMPEPSACLANYTLGESIGKNVIAALAGKKQQPLKSGSIKTANLGQGFSFLASGKLCLNGRVANLLRIYLILRLLPAFHRKKCIQSLLSAFRYKLRLSTRHQSEKLNLSGIFNMRSLMAEYPSGDNSTGSVSKLNIGS